MQAMIFAAGLGTRLYPVTADKPKALAPFLNTTLLHYNLEYLAVQGIDRFVINTHHFAGKISKYLKENNFFGFDISLSEEKVLLDTAGGLAFATKLFQQDDKPILLYNTDIICNINIAAFRKKHEENRNMVSLAIRNRSSSRYLIFDQDHNLCGWKNTATSESILSSSPKSKNSSHAFSGIHIISSSVLPLLESGKIYSMIQFYLEKMDEIKIQGFSHDADYWFDCGKPEDLAKAEAFLQNMRKT